MANLNLSLAELALLSTAVALALPDMLPEEQEPLREALHKLQEAKHSA